MIARLLARPWLGHFWLWVHSLGYRVPVRCESCGRVWFGRQGDRCGAADGKD